MHYTLEIEIEVPREKVTELFADPENWPKWQKSLVKFQNLDGAAGETGTRTMLLHKFGRRETEMVETIESNDLPDEMTCIYEAPGAWNRVRNRFVESGPDRTRWIFESEFRCTGLVGIMTLLLPGMFRKASQKDLDNFKHFAESEYGNP